MRCAVERGWVLAAAMSVSLPACTDGGGTDDAAMDDDGSGTTSEDPTEGEASGTADDTGGSGESGEDMGPWSSLEERPCPPDNILTYENFGGPFMLSFCTGCHHSRLPADMRQEAPLEVNFDDLQAVRDQADRIWIRSADQNFSMPPVGPPADEERMRLGEWLACGSPTDADLGM